MADWYGQHKQILKNHGSKRQKGISIHMKLTKTNIKEIKRNGNSLEKYVCDYILDQWDNYDDICKRHWRSKLLGPKNE